MAQFVVDSPVTFKCDVWKNFGLPMSRNEEVNMVKDRQKPIYRAAP